MNESSHYFTSLSVSGVVNVFDFCYSKRYVVVSHYFNLQFPNPGVGDGQGGLACCNSWGCKESDTTERLN